MPRPLANPPNPWATEAIDWEGEPPPAELEVFEEEARSILSENESPDVGFRWSINPYRGCYHGCAYCYARPTHQYLGFGAGTDFDRRIVVKVNAPELLREAFERRSWGGELIALSGNTDPYQPLEAHYRLTRRLLETCLAYRNPVGIITKGAVIRRDVDVLAALAREARCRVTLSIAFADDDTARALEPYASPVRKRFEALAALAQAGVCVGVSLGPIIPGVNDSTIPAVLERARDAGASYAFMILVRLPAEVLPVFDERLAAAMPLRHAKVMHAIRDMRGGRANDPRFVARMRGDGARWQVIEDLFRLHVDRLGLRRITDALEDLPTTFRRPRAQLDLFGD